MIHHSMQGGFAVRDGKWKLVMEQGRRQKRELYDLESDPSETTNVIADHKDVEARLVSSISKIIRNGRTTAGAPQPNDTPWWDDLGWMDKF
jgi:arylsulfatase A